MLNKINNSILKFDLNLKNKIVLTEAATGSYSSTPIIALLAGAKKVYALVKETKYGTFEDVKKEFEKYLNNPNFKIIKSLKEITHKIDIVTNSGFVRPIDEKFINYLDSNSVVTLMYEPWEFRSSDIDLELLHKNNIKVYGTNEHDKRLRTMDYIGLTVLYHLLDDKITAFSKNKLLILGNEEFTEPIERILTHNDYLVHVVNNYDELVNIEDFDIFIVAENKDTRYIIGHKDSYININFLNKEQKVIHICGNVDFKNAHFSHKPEKPVSFGYMSYRTDFIDDMALIDLQTASLKVAEGMIEANKLNLKNKDYKKFMESNYPSLSFDNNLYW
jgi:hypothetical protein